MAERQPKALRIGVIHGGKIVEERVLAPRQAVTIGTAAKNTFSVPRSGLPESFQIFSWQGDRYALHFSQKMEGRIQSGEKDAADFGALVSQGLATRQDDVCTVPVGEEQRGKIVAGDVTVLWQLVTPPPEAPRPVLPKEAKGNHFRSMDRLFVAVLTVSFLGHTGAYVALANAELPKEVTLEEIPDRYAKVLIPERLPKPEIKKEEKKAEQAAQAEEKKKDEKKPDGDEKKKESAEQVAAKKAARAAAVAKAVQSKGILKVLGALGPGTGSGAVADVFGSGGGVGDVATALAGAGGVALATDPGAAGRKGGGQGGAASIGDLATSGGGKVAYGAKSEVRVTGSVAAEEAEIDSSDIDQGKLAAFIRARMGLVKACYENGLKRNPNLKGKISVRFTILETGGLADITAAVNTLGSAEVASCIVNTVRTWRTQFRPSGPVTVEYPFVFSPVN
jgi:outer membrane biosynthesis protein TonB